jgi:MscS family membrane protein
MKKPVFSLLLCWFALTWSTPLVVAQSAPAPAAQTTAPADHATANADAEHAANTTAAAAVVAKSHVPPHAPDFLEHLVDEVLALFNVRESGNTWTHYSIAALLLVGAFLLRHIVTNFLFRILKKFAERTTTTLDDKLFPALEQPVAAFITVAGIFAALSVLKLSETSDVYLGYGSTVAFSFVIFWGLLRAFGAVLDHAQEIALERQMGVAAFMPWIKKALITIFVVFGLLMVVQSLGFDVKALLAGLGIGGLAFALAAQDTLANVFGSIVVAIDQPFKIGEAVKIGASEGVVEDIGLRSTKLRTPGRNLIIIPNKTVAAEAIINNSRFLGRRAEQVIGLTYDTDAAQLDAIVAEFRAVILAEPDVDPASVMVFFRDYNASSLDIWVAYNTKNADFVKHMTVRQRINLAMMRAVESHKLSFAFPTQTLHLDGEVARALVDQKKTQPAATTPAPRQG